MINLRTLGFIAAPLLLAFCLTRPAFSSTLTTNGDFETGDLTGWTTFTTSNGTIGTPTVVPFDTNGDGVATDSAQFQVGQVIFQPGVQEGGGIFQSFTLLAMAEVAISLDIAAQTAFSNGSGGIFSLLIDGLVVDSFNFGFIAGSTTERATLSALLDLSTGTHELRILMTRPFTTVGTTPFQYVDNVSVRVPEPSTLLLFGVGLAGLAGFGWLRRKVVQ